MADTQLAYVICYDIPDDRRRTKLAKTLAGFGRRAQYSVFEAMLSGFIFDRLRGKMAKLIRPDDDRVTVYPLCASCAARRLDLGKCSGDWPGTELVFVV